MKPKDRDFPTLLTLYFARNDKGVNVIPTEGADNPPIVIPTEGAARPRSGGISPPIVNSSTDAMPANALVLPTDGEQDVTLADIRRVVVVIRKGIGIV